MYSRFGLIAATCFVMHGSAAALDERGETALRELLKAMRDEIGQDNPQGGTVAPDGKLKMMSFVESRAKNPGSDQKTLEDYLDNMEDRFSQPAVKQAAAKLLEEFRREEREKEEAKVAAAKGLVQRIKQAVRTAKEPAEMDSLLEELGKRRYGGNDARESAEVVALHSTLANASGFVSSWQDYLSAKKNGDVVAAREILRNLKSNRGEFIPRSEILSLEASLPSNSSNASEIVAAIDSLDDVRQAIAKLNQVLPSGGIGPVADAVKNLTSIDGNYQSYKEGFPPPLRFMFYGTVDGSPEIGAKLRQLQADYYKLIAPGFVGAPKELIAKQNESIVSYFDRLEDSATKEENFNMALKVRELRRAISGNDYVSYDNSGIVSFIAGKNQEAAGQYELAVVSYQQALKTGNELVPVREIGARLAVLQAKYPEEYKAGVERFMDPPPSRYGPHPIGGNPSYYYQLGRAQSPKSGLAAPVKEDSPAQGAVPQSTPPKEPTKTPAEH